ncbi:MAG: protein kinase domain-containing protein [Chthoniobacterales bacterium]
MKDLFEAAVELGEPERTKFLEQKCAEDCELRTEVESLLASDQLASQFIEEPLLSAPRELLAESGDDLSGRKFGAYQILREIGRGGLGTVFLAERADAEYRKEVAIKLVRRGLDTEDILQRFRHERQILAQLDHPNIARLLDGGTSDDGRPFFVMEYVRGATLLQYCETQKLDRNARLELFREVCGAVSYAHRNLVIHRDLKPSNILVTEDGVPKLLDFGIAKLLTADTEFTQTIPALRVMTPEYASPEQVKGGKITTSSDVYSLGVLLYELLTGQKPYRLTSLSVQDLESAIIDQIPERPSAALLSDQKSEIKDQKSLTGDLDNIILMALRKEPERRYPTVERFSEDIRRHLAGLPVSARKAVLSYRAQKFIQRHKTGVAAVAAIVLLSLAGVAGILRQSKIARQERDNARVANATTQRVNQFLQRLLGSANPDRMGRDVKVVQVLDAASATLEIDLASDPAILAQAHLTIAKAYSQLRIAEPAESHARAALALDRKLYGDDHPATGDALAFLGRGLQVFNRFGEAEPLLRQALAIRRRHPEGDRDEYARTLLDLGWVLVATDRPKEGAPYLEEALSLNRKLHGEESAEVADALNNIGLLRDGLKDPADAEAAYRASLAIHRKLVPRQQRYLNPLVNLSDLLFRQGKIGEVERLQEEGIAFVRESIGEDNPTYGGMLGRMGMVDFVKQKYAEAVPKLERCLRTIGLVFPKENPEMVLAKTALGLSLTRTGRAKEAEPYLRAVQVEGKNVSANDLLLVGNLEAALGECLLAQKNFAEAEPLLRVAHKKLRSRFGETHPTTRAVAQLLKESETMAENNAG